MRALGTILFAVCAPLAAQSVQVNSANPNAAVQGTINLNVTISGKGFKNGANARFKVSGTTYPAGIRGTQLFVVSAPRELARFTSTR